MNPHKNVEIKFLADCKQVIPDLANLHYHEISKHWVPNANVERSEQNLIKHANFDKLPLTLVALINGQAVGMASLRENDGIQPERTPWLGSLVVDPAFRRKGIGEKLINAIKQQALLLGYSKLYLLAFDPSIPTYYVKLGWLSIGTDQYLGHQVAVMEIVL